MENKGHWMLILPGEKLQPADQRLITYRDHSTAWDTPTGIVPDFAMPAEVWRRWVADAPAPKHKQTAELGPISSRRDMLAGMALQGLITATWPTGAKLERPALCLADALIAALDNAVVGPDHRLILHNIVAEAMHNDGLKYTLCRAGFWPDLWSVVGSDFAEEPDADSSTGGEESNHA